MSIIVQKFGGTSVADSQKILAAARKAIRAQKEGHQVVMVVSAMGKNTDMLVSLAGELTDDPPAREMDMLLSTGEQVTVALMAMAIHSLGHEAISFTGAQIGIKTDSTHTKARIRSISTDRMREALDAGKIVIAAGFQGIDDDFNITTLGRGGSDTTAVALAAVLNAEACEIYTDVDGIFTTDPRIVADARKMTQISYDEMLELASSGAGVMHNRAIEFAKKFSVPVHVRSSASDAPGTMIVAEPESATAPVCGAAIVKNEVRVSVLGVPDRPGAALSIFSRVAKRRISMDMIVQNVGARGLADMSFTVFADELRPTLHAVKEAVNELGAEGYAYEEELSKVSIVGLGMAEQPGVAEKMFAAFRDRNINIEMITTSEIKISVLLDRQDAVEALRAVHEAFALDQPPPRNVAAVEQEDVDRDATEIVREVERMEDLIIDDISLDLSQARVTLAGVPDEPGLAAKLFEGLGEAGINIDMIVQNSSRDGRSIITVTVPRESHEKAVAVAAGLSEEIGCLAPTSSPKVAKLSVFGIGMRSHTGVAERIFRSFSSQGVNVDMVSTSEVRVNVVVDGEHAQMAIETLKKEFAEELA